jgi:hypothetical protein
MFDATGRRIGVAIGLVVVGIVVAIVALASGEEGAADRSTLAANRLCKTAEQEIAQASRQHGGSFESGNTGPLARMMFDAVGKLQLALGQLDVPDDELEGTVELKGAVFSAEGPILSLIRVPPRKRVVADARELESIESEVEDTAAGLGFGECARLSLRLPPLSS